MKQSGNQLNKAVFLDRDGVVNQPIIIDNKPFPPHSLKELVVYDSLSDDLKLLRNNNFLIFIITNQPDVKRGRANHIEIEEINNYLMKSYDFDDIFCCYHDDDDNCDCRKPKPGAILYFAKKYKIDLNKSFLIGDRKKDILSANNAGCLSVFIDFGYSEAKPETQNYTASNLSAAVNIILGKNNDKKN